LKLNIVDWLQYLQTAARDKLIHEETQQGVVLDEQTTAARKAKEKAESFSYVSKTEKSWRGLHHPVTAQHLLPRSVSYYDETFVFSSVIWLVAH
jgi:hypothetical protein